MPPRSVQAGLKTRQAHQQPPAPTKGTTSIPPPSYRGGEHTNSVARDGYRRRNEVMGRARGQSHRLHAEPAHRQRVTDYAMHAAVPKWTEFEMY